MTPPSKSLTDSGEQQAIAEKIAPKLAAAMAKESGEFNSITSSTPVLLNVKTAITLITGVAAIVMGGLGGYYALAATDRALENADKAMEVRATELERRVNSAATKSDLRELRLQVRMDLVNAVWNCSKVGTNGMQCRTLVSSGFNNGESNGSQ
jgi:hypothetical protein